MRLYQSLVLMSVAAVCFAGSVRQSVYQDLQDHDRASLGAKAARAIRAALHEPFELDDAYATTNLSVCYSYYSISAGGRTLHAAVFEKRSDRVRTDGHSGFSVLWDEECGPSKRFENITSEVKQYLDGHPVSRR